MGILFVMEVVLLRTSSDQGGLSLEPRVGEEQKPKWKERGENMIAAGGEISSKSW